MFSCYVTCLEQQSFCHALRKNLKFKLLYFQNKECYPAENKQADGNLDFLICDEDKNPILCLGCIHYVSYRGGGGGGGRGF